MKSIDVDKFGRNSYNEAYPISTLSSTFENCGELKSVHIKNCTVSRFGGGTVMGGVFISLAKWFIDCKKLESVDIHFDSDEQYPMMPFITVNFTDAFKNCISLKNIAISHNTINFINIGFKGMFSGCRLGEEQLTQLLDKTKFNVKPDSMPMNINIGHDSSIDPAVDKPEGSDKTWAELFADKNWTVTWEAYVEPVENAPKLMKAKSEPAKYYKLDEIPGEMLEIVGDMELYVKGGKHYTLVCGDMVSAPGPDGTVLFNTDVENVVQASNKADALEMLGASPVEK